MVECKFYREVIIKMFVSTSEDEDRLFKLCFNPILMVVQTGGVLIQDCPYNNKNGDDCAYG